MVRQRREWWTFAAPVIAAGYLVLGVGGVVGFDDEDSLASTIIGVAAAVAAAALVFGGLAVRRTRRALGSATVALGVAPASATVMFYWFPPALAFGIFCAVVAASALADATRRKALHLGT